MKYHKIRGVEKSVCTCEQKIAYNVAFLEKDSCVRNFKKEYNAQVVQIHKTDIAHEFVRACMKRLSFDEKIKEKYDMDAIQCALNAGAEKYLASKYSILTSYEEIGKMFPAYYL